MYCHSLSEHSASPCIVFSQRQCWGFSCFQTHRSSATCQKVRTIRRSREYIWSDQAPWMALIWHSKGKACHGNSSCHWHLKGQPAEPRPKPQPNACRFVISSRFFQTRVPCPGLGWLFYSSFPLNPVRVKLPGRQTKDSPLMRTPTLASFTDMWRVRLKRLGLTRIIPSKTQRQNHAYICFQSSWMVNSSDQSSFDQLCWFVEKTRWHFNEGIWIWLSVICH